MVRLGAADVTKTIDTVEASKTTDRPAAHLVFID